MANKSSRTKNAKLNMGSSLLLQVITAISGLILPRLIIPTYGSEVNGLIASITQFISYITLLEAGVGSVFRASLYKPILQNDMEKVSGILNEQKRFYRKIGLAFIIYIAGLCVVFPLIVKTSVDKPYIIALILILSVGTFLEYFVSLPYQSLIMADQMVRLINVLGSAVILANIVSTVILVKIGASILVVKLATCILAIAKPVVYVWYTKTHYNLNPKAEPDATALSQRWSGMVHHFAYYIHRNTDIIVLSVFVGTSTVSIYSIYLAVVTGIEKIVTSISSSLNAGIGNMLASGDKQVIDKTVDSFEFIQSAATTILYTITAIMLIPFIRLYTSNMVDANYVQPVFGYVLIMAEAIYCIRCVYSTVSMNGNKFKETQLGAILEGAVNLILSLALIFIFDSESMKLIAIAIGTLAGMFVRLLYEVVYLSKDLICRSVGKSFKMILISMLAAASSILACELIMDYSCPSVFVWIWKGLLTSVLVCAISLAIYSLFYKNTMRNVLAKLKR